MLTITVCVVLFQLATGTNRTEEANGGPVSPELSIIKTSKPALVNNAVKKTPPSSPTVPEEVTVSMIENGKSEEKMSSTESEMVSRVAIKVIVS